MRKTMRRGVFETNSSSVHSIVISLDDCPETDTQTYVLQGGSFHWGYDVCDTVQSRLEYLWQAVLCCTSEYDADWNRHTTERTQEWRERIERVLPNLVDGDIDDGIDHCDELYGWLDELEANEWMISSYLLGGTSHVIVSNDNADEYGFEYPDGPYMEYRKGN